jgi:hypothetical protein
MRRSKNRLGSDETGNKPTVPHREESRYKQRSLLTNDRNQRRRKSRGTKLHTALQLICAQKRHEQVRLGKTMKNMETCSLVSLEAIAQVYPTSCGWWLMMIYDDDR